MSEKLTQIIQEFIENNLRFYPKADETILRFIADIITHNGCSEDKTEDVHSLFAAGYCYYFALMLQDAFPGGTICWAAPFGHIVYQYHGLQYDIDGVYSGEAKTFIPISRLGNAIDDFRHIPGKAYNATEQELAKIQLEWEEEEQNENNTKQFPYG